MRGTCWLLLLSCVPVAAQNATEQPLTITISAITPSIKAGSDMRVIVKMTNNTTETLDESEIIRDTTSVDPRLVFEVRDTRGNLMKQKVYDHTKWTTENKLSRSILSGATLTEEQNISSFYDVSQPGIYVVQVSHSPSRGATGEVVKSNKLAIEVKLATLKSREFSQSEMPDAE